MDRPTQTSPFTKMPSIVLRCRVDSSRSVAHWLTMVGGMLLALGCGPGPEPLGVVTGRVTYQDAPFSEADILFSNQAQGVFITAPLREDGTYELRTAGRKGLPLGTYQVALRLPAFEAVTGGPQPVVAPRRFPNIPPRYRNPSTSGLVLNVSSGNNEFNIDLQP